MVGLAKKYTETTDRHVVKCPHCGDRYSTKKVIGRCHKCGKYENYGVNPKKD